MVYELCRSSDLFGLRLICETLNACAYKTITTQKAMDFSLWKAASYKKNIEYL